MKKRNLFSYKFKTQFKLNFKIICPILPKHSMQLPKSQNRTKNGQARSKYPKSKNIDQ